MIPAEGACVFSWLVAGPSGQAVELIFPGDLDKALELRRKKILFGFPFLFPFANRVFRNGKEGSYVWEDKPYAMPIHGFSNSATWSVVSVQGGAQAAGAVLALESSAQTNAMYPWSFRVELNYQLQRHQLTITQSIKNRDAKAMPLSPGWHPYFRVPLASGGSKGACILRVPGRTELGFDAQTYQMSGESKPFHEQETTLATHGGTGKYITDLSEPRVSLHDPAARMGVEMDLCAPDGKLAWPYILTWTLPDDAPFFCIEPYEGVTDAVHSGTGLRVLPPGKSYTTQLKARAVSG
jgi:galactose mutarotase-like enzyme